MNSHWMASFREDGKKLVLVNFQTSHEIILPPLDYIEYYHRGPSHLDYYVSWMDLVLQKIVETCTTLLVSSNHTLGK